jgi:REP element-mobilizing transposase RayT
LNNRKLISRKVIQHWYKYSRYDWQRIIRRKPAGFISTTLPFFENEEEEFLIKILCEVAIELRLKIAALNFCGDHVHAVIITENPDISKIIGLWKGKSAYIYNHRIHSVNENSQSKKLKSEIQNLWAKSFYQKVITSSTEFENVIKYVNTNRKKHGLKPITNFSAKMISTILENRKE